MKDGYKSQEKETNRLNTPYTYRYSFNHMQRHRLTPTKYDPPKQSKQD
jgi:hypothetical protein